MNHKYLFPLIASILSLAAGTLSSVALDLSHYAAESVLASGRWVKISVDETGLYRIPAATLRKWGFSDPNAVTIHGYGGRRIDDALTAANYIDDLPAVSTAVCPDGSVVFYAVGPHSWYYNIDIYTRQSNPYSTAGYYFVTDSRSTAADNSTAATAIPVTATPGAENAATSFIEMVQHEQDLVSPGECGQMLVGEDFRHTPSRNFDFRLPGICGDVTFRTSFVAKTYSTSSRLTFFANGEEVPSLPSDIIDFVRDKGEVHGIESRTTHSIANPGEQLTLNITHSSSTQVHNAWLNYIAVNYRRSLALPASGVLVFNHTNRAMSLAGASGATHVWDVTDPAAIAAVDYAADETGVYWTATQGGRREYAAWNDNATLPSPTFVANVANQNLHAHQTADMVIVAHQPWLSQAERIAELHRGAPDNLNVIIVQAEQVYNEFSSGCADVSGLRKYFKMLYDRGNAVGTPLRHVLLMGRMTYDERHLTAGVKALGAPTLPAWQQRDDKLSLNPEQGFATDDFIAMLDDGSGNRLGYDRLSVAVGRLPVTSLTTAKTVTDKIVDYVRSPHKGAWKNRIMALADDLDAGVHYKQTEWFTRGIDRQPRSPYMVEKIYLPAYQKSNGVYQDARDKMYRSLNEGVAWWTFVGHATNHSWTADGMLTYSDINSLYLRRLPFIYAATCNFLRWDSNTESGGEILMYEKNGGVIGMISATRPVYITYNGYYTNAIGKEVARRGSDGRLPTIGDIYRNSKNNIVAIDDRDIETDIVNNENRLRYVLMGDPAMRLATPDCAVSLESVNDIAIGSGDQIIIAARSMATLKGCITDCDGNLLSGFNGTATIDLYDSDRSVTLEGNEYATVKPFDQHGDKLYSGSCRVTDGHFTLTVAMPSDISDNFREATVALYAYSDDGLTEAAGRDRSCYVYGYDETTPADTEAPVIELLAANHHGFTDGGVTNADPMIIARVRDNTGINLSTAGIGHQMSIMVDDKRSYNDVSLYFTPAADGSPAGDIVYPLEGLTDGLHTVRLRVFDTDGNAAVREISILVRQGTAPTIFDIYTDCNPAVTEANFYLTHDRPESMLTVTVEVYNLLGHKLWEQTSSGRSDMFTSSPVTWDLTDGTGRRVPRGIYIYRATVTDDGVSYSTASRKIAVTSL